MRIVNIIGTRPQYIKLGAMSLEFDGHEILNIDTGQHYDLNMSDNFIKEMNLKIDKVTMNVTKIKNEINKFKPDIVLLYGDTYSSLLGLIASDGYLRGHIEAGVRSFNHSYIEENIRTLVDHGSDFCFCPSDLSRDNLIDEGKNSDKVFNTGDVMIDIINLYDLRKFDVKEPYIFMTLHRPHNVDNPVHLKNIMIEVGKCDKKVIFPIHPRTLKVINNYNIKIPENVKSIEPICHRESLQYILNATCTITDSGGIEKETYCLKTPGVIVREDTPWPETHNCGCNKLSYINEISHIVKMFDDNPPLLDEWGTPYGDGNARKKIMEILNENINS